MQEYYERVSKKVTQVKVKDNNYVFFHEQDSIFQLSDEISKDECDMHSTECNNCIKPNQKLKHWYK